MLYAELHCAEWHYDLCRHTDCCGAVITILFQKYFFMKRQKTMQKIVFESLPVISCFRPLCLRLTFIVAICFVSETYFMVDLHVLMFGIDITAFAIV